jgi:hypothetical protein
MKKFEFEEGDLYIAAGECNPENLDEAKSYFEMELRCAFKGRDREGEFINLYGKVHGLKGYAVLSAHGDVNEKGLWVYQDDRKKKPVQSWINQNDGRYSGLILGICNPDAHVPRVKKSVLLIPDREFVPLAQGMGLDCSAIFCVVVPGRGTLDSYVIDSEIKALEKVNQKL